MGVLRTLSPGDITSGSPERVLALGRQERESGPVCNKGAGSLNITDYY